MDKLNFSQAIDPFTNLSQFLQALDIINNTYSKKTNNVEIVTNKINNIQQIFLSPWQIDRFIGQVLTHSIDYGQDYFSKLNEFHASCRQFSLFNTINNKVLTPTIYSCYLCSSTKLEIRQTQCNKDPIVFSLQSIGNF
jgi:hypothetical protein